ncbi:Hpt domain-containing protein [Hyphococcus lacteus]|uniref:Hpt domain-containing protein n=1 Tax=Hyphococcus lacteus TaxID=3143536 RepID=A0ABV3Z3I7_9PROT
MPETQLFEPSHLQTEQVESLIAAAGVDGTRAILEAFQRSTLELLALLDHGLKDGSLNEAYKNAHAVKGSAANVGAQLLAEAAGSIEGACKDGNAVAALQFLSEAQSKFETFCVHFDAHLARY